MTAKKIKVLVVDDSTVMRMLLVELLTADPGIEVVGAVSDGEAALEFLEHERADVVLMDIHMPQLDGFEATRRIMETRPLPIIICTATADPRELAVAFRSMEAGAVACVEKPVASGPDVEAQRLHLLQTVRLMSEVKVVRRWSRMRSVPSKLDGGRQRPAASAGGRIIGIGASTGGPPALQTILSRLPRELPAPILIVQHIARGFLPGMVEWLNETTGLRVQIAAHGTSPLPGCAYVAPDDFHLGVSASGLIALAREAPENGLRPAISYLLRSLAKHFGPAAIGVLLTGMGKDGAAELKTLKEQGAYTIAQDRESSVVHGIPGEAIELGAATLVLPPERIADAIIANVTRKPSAQGVAER
jgi:two-component system, chemotaxis family, protein-glutamate methylesterase/glutaminase